MSWTQRYSYNFPTSIRFGVGVIDELAPYLIMRNYRHPLIVSDAALSNLGLFKTLIEELRKSGINPTVYSGVSKNPVESDVLSGVSAFHSEKCDSVIGFGGGASIDVARAIVLKAHHSRRLFDFDDSAGGDRFVTEEIPPFIAVPTTSGTGSEVGRSAVIAEDATLKKRILFSPRLMASKVFADPALTVGLPASVTAATGMDALTHNVEAYLAKGVSPMCDGIALEAIRLISESLEKACKEPGNLEARAKMMIASLMGAAAFQKGLGVVHSTAHPLSTMFDTHHGLANAVMMPFGLEFNRDICADKYAFLAKVIGVPDFVDWVRDLNKKIGVPDSLTRLDLDADKLEPLADLAFADPCHQSNPKPVSREDFVGIYRSAFKL